VSWARTPTGIFGSMCDNFLKWDNERWMGYEHNVDIHINDIYQHSTHLIKTAAGACLVLMVLPR